MSWVPVAIEALFLGVVTGWLLWYFGSIKSMKWYTMLSVFVGWFFVFSVVILLPNDIAKVNPSLLLPASSFLLPTYSLCSWS